MMIDKSMCEPMKDRRQTYRRLTRLFAAASIVIICDKHFGFDGGLLAIGLYLYIEGLHNDRV